MAWTNEKILKKGTKYLAFYLISFIIANVFLAYIVGSGTLIAIARDNPSNHVKGLFSILVFSGVFYFVYAYMREQVCTIVCPYGRLQSVLIDDKTLMVAYDYKRGEPREKWGRKRNEDAGDCISCAACVEVCPTGIDIRNGLQLECINCTACIDSCNDVMTKIGKPKGLIRFESQQGIESKLPFKMNSRRVFYSILLGVLISVLVIILSLRSNVQATVLRTPGMAFMEDRNGKITNLYNVKILNKTFKPMEVSMRLESINGVITYIGKEKMIAPAEEYGEGVISIAIDKSLVTSNDMKLQIGLYSGNKKIQTIRTSFMGPDASNYNK